MKSIKMIGLAALAALMAMAFVGTSSAMAERTALCKEDAVSLSGEACPEASEISHVHEVSVGKGKLLSSIVNIECNVEFLGDTVAGTSAPLKISGHFTYPAAGCETTSGTACTVTEAGASATIEVLKTAHELAEVKGSAEVNAHCGALINCTYNGAGLLGHGLGPLLSSSLNGNVNISEQKTNKIGGALCPKEAFLDLTTSPLEHTYLAKLPGKMVCLKVGPNRGRFLAEGAGGHCETEMAANNITGEYELATVARNQNIGEMACGEVAEGRFLAYNNGIACGTEDGTRVGTYELGEIRN